MILKISFGIISFHLLLYTEINQRSKWSINTFRRISSSRIPALFFQSRSASHPTRVTSNFAHALQLRAASLKTLHQPPTLPPYRLIFRLPSLPPRVSRPLYTYTHIPSLIYILGSMLRAAPAPLAPACAHSCAAAVRSLFL